MHNEAGSSSANSARKGKHTWKKSIKRILKGLLALFLPCLHYDVHQHAIPKRHNVKKDVDPHFGALELHDAIRPIPRH